MTRDDRNRDVTPSHAGAADDAIGEREARMRSVFESIDEGWAVCEMILDPQGNPTDYRFLEVNRVFEHMTGLADAVGRTAYELVPDLEPVWVETYAKVALARETLRFEQGSDVMGRWFDVFAVPVEPHGRFALVFRDESERRRAELARSEMEQRFRAMTEELPMFVWKHGPDDEFQWVNQTLCAFLAMTREEILDGGGRFVSHPDDDSIVPAIRAARHARVPYRGQMRVKRHDGVWRWIEAWGRPRFDTDGRYLGYVGAALDVTERVDAEATARRSALFLRRLLDNLFSFVGVLTPDGTLVQANQTPLDGEVIDADDAIGRKFWELRWWSLDDATQQQLRDALARAAAGETVRYDVQVLGADDSRMWIDFQVAPLRDETGTVTHLVASGHVISERIETEQRLAAALDAERRARERVELLQRSATRLGSATTVDDVAEVLLGELSTSLGLELTALNVLDGDHLEVIAPSQMPDAAVDRYQHVHVDAELPGPIAIRTNQPVIVLGHDQIGERFPDVLDAANHLPKLETMATLPLRGASGHAIGALFLASPLRGWLDAAMLDVLTSIAGQAGLALERAQLYRQVLDAHRAEHAIASQLQRALLPDRVVEHPAVRIAARYMAASDLMAIGGDWYDTFMWADGQVGVTVGDVVGHDIAAATTMGRLRIGVNALMSRCPADPGAVLDAHEDYGRDLGPAFATAVSVVVRSETGELAYASAGHPGPLVMLPDGTTQWLTEAVTPPLGVDPEGGHVAKTVTLQPGATVVLYSDGLIERRGAPLDVGFERLEASARRHAGADPDALADSILGDLTDGIDIADDVIVVCLRWNPVVSDPT